MKLPRSLPDAHENILQRLLCKGAPPENSRQAGKQEWRGKLVQALEGAGVSRGTAVQQGLQLFIEIGRLRRCAHEGSPDRISARIVMRAPCRSARFRYGIRIVITHLRME